MTPNQPPRRLIRDLIIVAILTLIFWGILWFMNPDASPLTRLLEIMEVR